MSKFVQGQLEIKSESALIDALTQIFGKNSVEVTEKGKTEHLYGYMNDKRTEKADVIVRRSHVDKISGGSSNDLGFIRQENGSLKMIVSEYDKSKSIDERINTKYSEIVIERTIKKLKSTERFKILSKSREDGSLVIKIGRRKI